MTGRQSDTPVAIRFLRGGKDSGPAAKMFEIFSEGPEQLRKGLFLFSVERTLPPWYNGNRNKPVNRRNGMKTYLRILSCLAALLILLIAAAVSYAETADENAAVELTYAERLEQARQKYNEKTIHIYRSGIGNKKKGKLNVCMCWSKENQYYYPRILESIQITDEAEMEAILEFISNDKNFNKELFGTISNMKAQWIAHNLVHSMATGSEDSQKMIEMLVGDDIASIIGRSKELDLSTINSMSPRESLLYSIIEMVYQTDKQ